MEKPALLRISKYLLKAGKYSINSNYKRAYIYGK